MMRKLVIQMLMVAAVPFAARAVQPQFWKVDSAEELMGGEVEGFAVTSRGELTLGPAATRLASFPDPFVLSQASGPGGELFFGTGNEGKVYRLNDGKLDLLFDAPEAEIYALAVQGGMLFAASSPYGK
ncbi:MAG TPA: hypothetical protein VM534_00485, partial [Thermoanaerobaculia bacterium]|nr:hypothetical protein [Thermoanaerobaculia bacterium]